MLRPFGNGWYPGVHLSEDDVPEDVETDRSEPPRPILEPPVTEACEEDEETPTFEEALTNAGALTDDINDLADDSPAIHEPTSSSDTPPPPSGPGVRPIDFVLVGNHWVHKSSVCRIAITPDYNPLSKNRCERVRGHQTLTTRRVDVNSSDAMDGDFFNVGRLLLTLVRKGKQLSLALIRVTAIQDSGTSRRSIKSATLFSDSAGVKVTGQIMTLLGIQLPPSSENHDTSSPDSQSSGIIWVWNGSYLKAPSPIQGSNEKTERVVLVTLPGYLTEPINPCIIYAEDRLTLSQCDEINAKQKTWEVSGDILDFAAQALWVKAATQHKLGPSSLVSVAPDSSSTFPYQLTRDGNPGLLCDEGCQQLAKSGEHTIAKCPLCTESIHSDRPGGMRAHVSGHILRSTLGVPESKPLHEQVGETLP
ncbi:hypothetical protein BV22DRAFT_1135848, partial [Leucogyrophana mollusca]